MIHNLLIRAFDLRVSIVTQRKIARIYKNVKKKGKLRIPPRTLVEEHCNLFKSFRKKVNKRWLIVYGTVSEIQDYKYIPEDIYYNEIEPRLNFKPLSKAYTDKNIYSSLLKESLLPRTILRNVNGVFYDAEWNAVSKDEAVEVIYGAEGGRYVIKPSVESGGGRSVRVLEISEKALKITPAVAGVTSCENILDLYKTNYIIQEYVRQHPFFAQFNASSVNTVRILTYRSVTDEKVHILHRILRLGKPGSIVDNQAAGGLACGINCEGRLSRYAVDKTGTKYSEHNGNTFASTGSVPGLESICRQAKIAARQFPYARILGMDFMVDENEEPVLLEVNNINNEINFYQMTEGPLFGEFTHEVINFCAGRARSFLIDFEI